MKATFCLLTYKSSGRSRSFGPNAKAIVVSGGLMNRSAALKPSYFVTAYGGIVSALEQAGSETEVTYSEGTSGLFPLLYCELSNF